MSNSLRDPTFEKIIGLLESPECRQLFKLAANAPLTQDEILELRMPMGISVKEAQQLIDSVCKLFSIEYPIVNEDGIRYWFYPSREILQLIREIDMKASEVAPISQARKSEFGARLDSTALQTATNNIFSLAGFAISKRRSEGISFMDSQPNTPKERLYRNVHGALKSIPFSTREARLSRSTSFRMRSTR